MQLKAIFERQIKSAQNVRCLYCLNLPRQSFGLRLTNEHFDRVIGTRVEVSDFVPK